MLKIHRKPIQKLYLQQAHDEIPVNNTAICRKPAAIKSSKLPADSSVVNLVADPLLETCYDSNEDNIASDDEFDFNSPDPTPPRSALPVQPAPSTPPRSALPAQSASIAQSALHTARPTKASPTAPSALPRSIQRIKLFKESVIILR